MSPSLFRPDMGRPLDVLTWDPSDRRAKAGRLADGEGLLHLGGLLRLWHAARYPGTLPARAQFGPDVLRPWLGWVSVWECEDDDFRVRLDGSQLVALSREDWTGRCLSALDREHGDDLVARSAAALGLALPLWDAGPLLSQKRFIEMERLLLPVRDTRRRTYQVINVLVPRDERFGCPRI